MVRYIAALCLIASLCAFSFTACSRMNKAQFFGDSDTKVASQTDNFLADMKDFAEDLNDEIDAEFGNDEDGEEKAFLAGNMNKDGEKAFLDQNMNDTSSDLNPVFAAATAQQSRTFCLVDSATQIPVEKMVIPKSWTATGQVIWNPKDQYNFVLWKSVFYEPSSGSSGAIFSFVNLRGNFVYANELPYMKDPKQLAKMFIPDIKMLLGGLPKDLQLFDAQRVANRDPALDNYIRKVSSQFAQAGMKNVQGTQFTAKYSFTKNGKKWLVKAATPVVSYDANVGHLRMGNVQFLVPRVFISPMNYAETFQNKLNSVIASRKDNPEWNKVYQQICMQITQSNLQSSQQISRILQDKQDYIRNLSMDSYNKRSASQDRINKNWSNYMRDVDVVQDPFNSSRKVVVSDDHSNPWINNSDGSVLYSDDSNFNPNTVPQFNNQEWRRVEK